MATTTTTEVSPLPHELISEISTSPQQQQQDHRLQVPLAPPPATTTTPTPVHPLTIELTPSSTPDHTYPTGAQFYLTATSLVIVLISGGLSANIVATALPSITTHFHTLSYVGFYSSSFRLCTCSFQFFFSKLYTLFSIKTIFLLSISIFLIGDLLCATAVSNAMFIMGRAVAGVGFAGNLAGCFAVVVVILPNHKRPVFAGVMACVESCAIIAAPVVGGALTQGLGWGWCFWINLPIGFISLATMFFLFSDPRPPREEDHLTFAQKLKKLDLVSNCLFIPSLTALFVALSWAGTRYPWSDAKVIGLFVVFAVLLAAFIYNQHRRGDSAALPFRIIKNRSVIAGFIFTTCTNSMTNVLEWYLPTYYQVVRGHTPATSGYLTTPILIGMMLGLFLQGLGTTLIGYYAPFMLLASLLMPIASGLMTTYNLHTTLSQFIVYSGLAGFSGGIGFQGSQAAVQTTLSPADVNLGIGVILFGQSMGPAVFIAVAQVLFTNELVGNLNGVLPGLSPRWVQEHGLGDILKGVGRERWDEVRGAIDRSLTSTWYLTVALGCGTMVGSLLVEWRSVKEKRS